MGVENNECIVATTWNYEAASKIKDWVQTLSESERELFAFIPSLVNDKITVFMAPDGSKKGWEAANRGEDIRNQFIEQMKTFDNIDGSNPFKWVEVGYGEFGQKVLRGNCRNEYGR